MANGEQFSPTVPRINELEVFAGIRSTVIQNASVHSPQFVATEFSSHRAASREQLVSFLCREHRMLTDDELVLLYVIDNTIQQTTSLLQIATLTGVSLNFRKQKNAYVTVRTSDINQNSLEKNILGYNYYLRTVSNCLHHGYGITSPVIYKELQHDIDVLQHLSLSAEDFIATILGTKVEHAVMYTYIKPHILTPEHIDILATIAAHHAFQLREEYRRQIYENTESFSHISEIKKVHTLIHLYPDNLRPGSPLPHHGFYLSYAEAARLSSLALLFTKELYQKMLALMTFYQTHVFSLEAALNEFAIANAPRLHSDETLLPPKYAQIKPAQWESTLPKVAKHTQGLSYTERELIKTLRKKGMI